MNEPLLVEKRERVTLLSINRPEVRNALDDVVSLAIREAIVACEDDGTRCIVLTGAGGAFSSGADIKKAFAQGITPESIRTMLIDGYHPTLKAIREASWPVIAAVDGYAAGIGCDFALACDLRLISERARFAELFARVGLIPDGGGTYMLPRLVGLGRAMELMFTGRDVLAAEALQIGLANKAYPVEGFLEQVMAYAAEIAKNSPHALKRGKVAMIAALDSNYNESLAREAQFQQEIFAQPDGIEGFQAFIEKRDPMWR